MLFSHDCRYAVVLSSVTHMIGLLPKLPLACCSRLCLLAAVLVLSVGPVYADWAAIEPKYQTPGLQTVYIDSTTIRREGNLTTMKILVDWKWMQGSRSPRRFLSTKITKQFDCAEKRFRTLASTDYYGHMGTGMTVYGEGYTSGHWVALEPEGVNQGLWEAACGRP